jgi:hypothetical protein
MTTASDKDAMKFYLAAHVGTAKRFECLCGNVTLCDESVPPAIICPQCGGTVLLKVSGRKV